MTYVNTTGRAHLKEMWNFSRTLTDLWYLYCSV